jgi:hypothetical protein
VKICYQETTSENYEVCVRWPPAWELVVRESVKRRHRRLCVLQLQRSVDCVLQ